ncbi:uncharacterized protein LOC110441794 [Mizuhopecten yessoensis]|uniref:CUB domain-containing protein n=1 Tax=Mizuhopecten yessoensis TaxID=6573 RepID=A0A210R157_MIZYE|nr:uncharacterized protein LOC110441794 [Mizuhopecten yessoensis]OWF54631.1 hypothetical protein KP79_PYT04358 [Mizuhopecten yessoensis]
MDNLVVIASVLVFSGITSAINVTVSDLRSGQFLTRCVTRHADFMNITCPSHKVMLAPKLIAGYSDSSKCVFNGNDCLGMSKSLERETQACANQETCSINLRRILETLVPLPGQRKICKGKPLTYVSVIPPKCVDKGTIHDMCSGNEALPINPDSGIISSYNNPGRTINTPCIRRFGSTSDVIRLSLNFLDIQIGLKNRPRVVWTSESGELRKKTFKKLATFSEKGSKFEIKWRPQNTDTTREGCVVYYNVKVIGKSTQGNLRLASDQPSQTPTHYLVQATLKTSMTWNDKQSISMSCPRGKVIYAPDVTVTSSRYTGCEGLSPHLLVQRNECYWRRNCTMEWRGPAFLTMTSSARCFGRVADIFKSRGFKCEKEGNIINICDTRVAKLPTGIVRSHGKYPWHYPRVNKRCRQRIRIGRGRQLTLQLDDVDIDDERDTFFLRHIRKGRKTTILFRGNDGNMSKTLSGGTVEITFSTKRRSKAGSGFILHYERTSKNRKKVRSGERNKRRSRGTGTAKTLP